MVTQFISLALILGGVLFLGLALRPIFRIVKILPKGDLQKQWKILGLFVVLFMSGYIVYAVELWFFNPSNLVPAIFFFGGFFVLLVANLSEKTAKDMRKIATLKKESITDTLMGIYNRRFFERRLTEEVRLCLQNPKRNLSLLIMDADHFKKINDTYGHQKGDEVLKVLADKIKLIARKNDIIARYGGEEICIIAPSCSKQEALVFSERLRFRIASGPITECAAVQEEIYIQVSIGVATWTNGECAESLLSKADKALYLAKKRGRNQVVHADELNCEDS